MNNSKKNKQKKKNAVSLVESQLLSLLYGAAKDRCTYIQKQKAISCHSALNCLEKSCIPRKELKGQLKTPFERTQLVNITAEASVFVVISRAKLLQANIEQSTLLCLNFPHGVKHRSRLRVERPACTVRRS